MKTFKIGKGCVVSVPWAILTTTDQICSDLVLKIQVQLTMDLCQRLSYDIFPQVDCWLLSSGNEKKA